MTTKSTYLAAAALAALCAGCRSDGGIGRSDSSAGMKYSTGTVAAQYRADVAATKSLVSNIPEKLSRSVSQSMMNLRETYYLYLQNGRAR